VAEARVWISVEGRPAERLVSAFGFAWEVREGLAAAGVPARLFSAVHEWEAMARAPRRVVFPVEETCSTPPYAGDRAGVRQRLQDEGIPFVGSGAAVVRAVADKGVARERLRAAGLPVAGGLVFRQRVSAADAVRRYARALAFPAVAKPALGGGSRGVAYVADAAALREVLERWDWRTQGPPLVEEYVPGPEATAWVAGVGDAVRCAGVRAIDRLGHPIFGRTAKAGVRARGTTPAPPPEIPAGERARAAAAAVAAHQALGLRSYSRADLVLSSAGPVIVEVNSRPHLALRGQASVADGDLAAFGAFLAARVQEAAPRAPRE
jgi:D-alanine-D-alanine ligase